MTPAAARPPATVRLRTVAAILVVLGAVAALLLTVRGAPAPAPAAAVTAAPADGSRLAVVPRAIVLHFGGPVDAAQTHVSIQGPAGAPARPSEFSVAGAELSQPLPAAGNGTYLVGYHAVLTDGREVSGATGLVVGDGPYASAARAQAATDAAAHVHVEWNGPNLALLGVDVLLVAGLLMIIFRRPRVRDPGPPHRWSGPPDL